MLRCLGYKFRLNGIQVESTYSNVLFYFTRFFWSNTEVPFGPVHIFEHSALGHTNKKMLTAILCILYAPFFFCTGRTAEVSGSLNRWSCSQASCIKAHTAILWLNGLGSMPKPYQQRAPCLWKMRSTDRRERRRTAGGSQTASWKRHIQQCCDSCQQDSPPVIGLPARYLVLTAPSGFTGFDHPIGMCLVC